MKKFFVVLPAVAMLAACATQEQNTLAGAVAGGAAGAAIGNTEGALIGTAIGATVGANVDTGAKPSCVYTRPDGSKYNAVCP
jgi:uncharacterized protein YcfJ